MPSSAQPQLKLQLRWAEFALFLYILTISDKQMVTNEENVVSKQPPADKCKFVYATFVWLGIGALLPWNIFICVSKATLIDHFCTNLSLR